MTSFCLFFQLYDHMLQSLTLRCGFQVILIQEQLSKNRIIIDTDSKGRCVLVMIFYLQKSLSNMI